MAATLDKFTGLVADSGLLSAADVQAFIEGLPEHRRPQDGEQLARELVRQKKLTAYQAQQIYAGKGKSLLLGNYVLLEKLGQGGMGMVFKAEHRVMARQVALKILSPAVTNSPEALRRFQREVRAAAKLDHANIVTAYDADTAGGIHFLVMQYVAGTDLAVLVKSQGPLPLEQALSCVLQAARGLDYAHSRGVVHRDIKPANLLLDHDGTVKILDMGLARLESAGAEQDQLTGSGQIMGTLDYMAPEQAMDTKHADARADIYSLGITLWYLLTGRVVYGGESMMAKLMAHRDAPIPSLCEACPQAPAALDAVLAKMLAKTPETRYQSMAQVIADLERSCAPPSDAAPELAAADGGTGQFDDFLRELGPSAMSHGQPQAARRPAPAIAKSPAPAVGGSEATVGVSSPQAGTDPNSRPSLTPAHRGRTAAKPIRRTPRPPTWLDWRILTAAGVTGLLLISLGVWVIVRDKEGRETARVAVPDGGSATIQAEAAKAAKNGSRTPPSQLGSPASKTGGSSAPRQGTGWRPLAIERGLPGWKVFGSAQWNAAAGGVLQGTGRTGWLGTDQTYSDFELRLEFRLSKGANSGIFLRAWPEGPTDGRDFIEIQLLDESAAEFATVEPLRQTAAIFNTAAPSRTKLGTPEVWHTVEIRANGPNIRVQYDGQVEVDADLKRLNIPNPGHQRSSGRIGLQALGGTIEFRNLSIRPIDK